MIGIVVEVLLPENWSEEDFAKERDAFLSDPGGLAWYEERQATPIRVTKVWATSDLLQAARTAKKTPREFIGEAAIAALLSQPDLGSLSAKYESRGAPAAIGKDSNGGWSYGTYQLASAQGSVALFLNFLQAHQPAMAQALDAAGGDAAARQGMQSFRDAWTRLATDPNTRDAFTKAQHAFIKATYYDPFAAKLASKLGINLSQRSNALRQVAWSTAVQHGPNNSIFSRALGSRQAAAEMSDADIIRAVYAERSKVDIHFPSSTPAEKAAVHERFENELQDALALLP